MFGEMQLAERVGFEIAVRWCLVNGGVFSIRSDGIELGGYMARAAGVPAPIQRASAVTGTPLGSIPVGSRARRGSVQRIELHSLHVLISSGHPFGR